MSWPQLPELRPRRVSAPSPARPAGLGPRPGIERFHRSRRPVEAFPTQDNGLSGPVVRKAIGSPSNGSSTGACEAAAQRLHQNGHAARAVPLSEATVARYEQVLGDTTPTPRPAATTSTPFGKLPRLHGTEVLHSRTVSRSADTAGRAGCRALSPGQRDRTERRIGAATDRLSPGRSRPAAPLTSRPSPAKPASHAPPSTGPEGT
jgi:hypothetical protein